MDKRYVIVGAGLAGATCAYLLKLAGRDVTLLERGDAATKSKLCGGLMTPRSMELAERIFGAESMEGIFGKSFSKMFCITERHDVMIEDIHMRSLFRKDLDDLALGRYLELGGKLVDHCSVKEVDFDSNRVHAIVGKSDAAQFDYDVLIAADGALSSVRASLQGHAPMAALCLEADVKANPVQPLTMLYDSGLHGYCWYIPRGEGEGAMANVGCVSYNACDELEEYLRDFAGRMGVSYSKRKGAFLPTGGDILLSADNVHFIGDASGLICPPTGEGIYYALLCAETLFRALSTGDSYERMMRSYAREVSKQYRTRDTFFSKRFMNTALFAADHTPYGTQRAVKFALKHFASF